MTNDLKDKPSTGSFGGRTLRPAAAPATGPVGEGAPGSAPLRSPDGAPASKQTGSGPLADTGSGRLVPRPPLIPEPQSIEETGLNSSLLTDLILKTIYFAGQITAQEISQQVKLPFSNIVESVLDFLKREELVGIIGSRGFGERGFQYAIAPKGGERVREALLRSQYVGPAPVPLKTWVERVKAQSITSNVVRQEDVRAALAHLVLSPKTFRKIGPAVNSGRSIFLYGPPGNGKTTIAQAMATLLKGMVYIPYAIDVDSQIIRVYDRLNHVAVAENNGDAGPQRAAGDQREDTRWVLCKRPVVIVGGELTLNNLDLIYDPSSKFYEAPFQMKASNGLFMIDDFGRQQVRPQDLLNRWIVPLETRIDFLTLHTGKKIEVPFDQLLVFSTNLDPKSLVDDAFLRRIRHKIEIPDPTDADFYQIFQRVAAARKVQFDQQAFIYLLQEWYIKKGRAPKAVHPRDLLDQILDITNYQGIHPAMTKELLVQACEAYFVNL
ncbi:MAG: ATP-binding protein [Chloroflexi bacterium]|nr:ATP-binding protein [Chloroflexota bacterium]